jgi:hypothetical protein
MTDSSSVSIPNRRAVRGLSAHLFLLHHFPEITVQHYSHNLKSSNPRVAFGECIAHGGG